LAAPLVAALAVAGVDSSPPNQRRIVRTEEKAAESGRYSHREAVLAAVAPNGAVERQQRHRRQRRDGPGPAALDTEEPAYEPDAEDEEDHSMALMAKASLANDAREGTLKLCAAEGGICACEGVVGYGSGKVRVFERVSGTIRCVGANFTEEPGTTGNDCLCYDLGSCGRFVGHVVDPAHRRRTHTGTKGEQMYQRRRWCGFGPRTCQWGEWGNWSACNASCGNGTQQRARAKLVPEVNGGMCKDATANGDGEETRACMLKPCANDSTAAKLAGPSTEAKAAATAKGAAQGKAAAARVVAGESGKAKPKHKAAAGNSSKATANGTATKKACATHTSNLEEKSRKYSSFSAAHHLNKSMLDSSSAWSPKTSKSGHEWMELTLPKAETIVGIVTEGRKNKEEWVKTYKVKYSSDGSKWTDAGILKGNTDQHTKVTSKLKEEIVAKHVRIYPLTWHGHIAMRAALLTCKAPDHTSKSKTAVAKKTTGLADGQDVLGLHEDFDGDFGA